MSGTTGSELAPAWSCPQPCPAPACAGGVQGPSLGSPGPAPSFPCSVCVPLQRAVKPWGCGQEEAEAQKWGPCGVPAPTFGVCGAVLAAAGRWVEPGPSPVLAVTRPCSCLTPAPRTHPTALFKPFLQGNPSLLGLCPIPAAPRGSASRVPSACCGHGAVGSVPLRGALAGCGLAKHFWGSAAPVLG